MAIEIGNLLISMQADVARLSSDMGKARRTVDDAMGGIRRSAEMATRALNLIGVGVSVTAFAGWIKTSIDAADAMNDLASKTGIAVETLSTYKLLAEQNGTTVDGMAIGMKNLAKTMAEHPEYFAKIGVATKDASGNMRSLDDVMKDVADKFSGYKDGAAKAALAQDIFGKSGMDMIPVLNQGAVGFKKAEEEAKKYGIALDSDFAAAADRFKDKMSLIEAKSQATARVIAGPVLKSLNDLADALLIPSQDDSFKNFLIGTSLGLAEFVRVSALGVKTLTFTFRELSIIVGTAGEQLLAATRLSTIGSIGDIGRDGIKRLAAARDEYIKDSESLIKGSFAFGNPSIPQNADKPKTKGSDAPNVNPATTKVDEYANLIGEAQKRISVLNLEMQGEQRLTEVQKWSVGIMEHVRDGKLKIAQGHRAEFVALMENVLALDKENEVRKHAKEAAAAQADVIRQLAGDFDRSTEAQLRTLDIIPAAQRKLGEEMDKIAKNEEDARHRATKLYIENKLNADEYATTLALITAETERQREATRNMADMQNSLNGSWQYGAAVAMRSYLDDIQNVAKQSEHAFTNAFKGMEDALVKFVRTGKLDFKSLADSILNDMIRMQIQQSITGPLSGFISRLFSGGTPAGASGGASSTSQYSLSSGSSSFGLRVPSAAGGFDIPSGINPLTQLHEREMVLPAEYADAIRGMTRGGASSAAVAPNVVVNVVNKGQPVSARQQGAPQFDGREWVIGVVLDAADTNPQFRNAMGLA